jgi:hypothetical protein
MDLEALPFAIVLENILGQDYLSLYLMYCTKMTENLATGNFLKKMSV